MLTLAGLRVENKRLQCLHPHRVLSLPQHHQWSCCTWWTNCVLCLSVVFPTPNQAKQTNKQTKRSIWTAIQIWNQFHISEHLHFLQNTETERTNTKVKQGCKWVSWGHWSATDTLTLYECFNTHDITYSCHHSLLLCGSSLLSSAGKLINLIFGDAFCKTEPFWCFSDLQYCFKLKNHLPLKFLKPLLFSCTTSL